QVDGHRKGISPPMRPAEKVRSARRKRPPPPATSRGATQLIGCSKPRALLAKPFHGEVILALSRRQCRQRLPFQSKNSPDQAECASLGPLRATWHSESG